MDGFVFMGDFSVYRNKGWGIVKLMCLCRWLDKT